MRVALLVSGSFLNYRNGINTFIKSLSSMLASNHIVDIVTDCVFDADSDLYQDPALKEHPNISAMYWRRTRDIEKQPDSERELYGILNWDIPSMERSLGAYLMRNTPDVVIANDVVSAAVLVDASQALLTGTPCYYYGHLPDDIFDDTTHRDLGPQVLDFHRANLTRRGAMRFLSSTETAVRRYSKYGQAFYAPMPCQNFFKESVPNSNTVWVNSGNYPRKRIELMRKVAEAAGASMVFADGTSTFESILKGAVNCAVMLHLSSGDIMPYGVLEACGAMHIVLADDAEWANELPINNFSKIDVRDIPTAAKQLKRILNKAASFHGDDMIVYNAQVEAIWQELLS